MSNESPHAAAAPTALVVEDDEHIATPLKFILEHEGFAVVLARRAGGTATHRHAGAPRLVLLDVMLPRADGFQLIARFRAKPDWAASPIVMLTSQEGDIVRALDAGANDYLVKPSQPNELKARIRRLARTAP